MRYWMALAMVVLAACRPAAAGEDQDAARRAVEEGRSLPLSAIVSHAAEACPGQLIEAELEDKGDRMVYELKILTPDGRLVTLFYDARSGARLERGRP